jgi:hypothetical protein
MAINRNEIEKFFENLREIRNLAIDGKNKIKEAEKTNTASSNTRYIGIYLSNYYSKNINKKFHDDLLK